MKKSINALLLILIMFMCPVFLWACGKEQSPKVVDFSVQLQTDKYKFENGKIVVEYRTTPLVFSGSDFRVTLKYDDNSTIVVRENNLNYKGFKLSSNLPTSAPATVGEYTLTFSYGDLQSKTLTVQVIKTKLELTGYEWDYSIPYTYDGGEKIITLKNVPAGMSATYEGNRQTKAGKHKAIAYLSYIDQTNYLPLGYIELEWEILKANVDLTGVKWSAKSLPYTGSAQSVELQNLPTGVTATYEGNTATGVGNYTAVAHLTYVDQENYNPIEDITYSWSIVNNEFSQLNYVAFGDSITYGVDGETGLRMKTPYPNLVAEELGLKTVSNYAVSGSTVSFVSGLNNVNSQYETATSAADIVSVMIGVNDYARSATLGTINDNDLTTIYGGLNCLVEGLKAKYPNAFIFFMTPFDCYRITGKNTAGVELIDVVNAVKEVCLKNNIPCLDMYSWGKYTMELDPKSDGIHPTQNFFTNYTSNQISKFVFENYSK